jgi:hypothetical protein
MTSIFRIKRKEGIVLNPPRQRWRWARTIVVVPVLLFTAATAYAECWGNEATVKGYANTSLLVSGQEVADHLAEPGIRILDARRPERYAAGHIPGAVNLPIAEIARTINGVPGVLAPVAEVEQALGRRGVSRDSYVGLPDSSGSSTTSAIHA